MLQVCRLALLLSGMCVIASMHETDTDRRMSHAHGHVQRARSRTEDIQHAFCTDAGGRQHNVQQYGMLMLMPL